MEAIWIFLEHLKLTDLQIVRSQYQILVASIPSRDVEVMHLEHEYWELAFQFPSRIAEEKT